jgi:hypothetical protein
VRYLLSELQQAETRYCAAARHRVATGPCTLSHLPRSKTLSWRRAKFQPSPSHHILKIALRETLCSFRDSRWVSNFVVLRPWKKFNRRRQQVSEPYHGRTYRGSSSNGRAAGASVYVQKSRVTTLGILYVLTKRYARIPGSFGPPT